MCAPGVASCPASSEPSARWVPNCGRNTQVRRMAKRMTAAPALPAVTAQSSGISDRRPTARVTASAPVVKARLTPVRAAAVAIRWLWSNPPSGLPAMPPVGGGVAQAAGDDGHGVGQVAAQAGFEGGEGSGIGHGADGPDPGEAEQLVGEDLGVGPVPARVPADAGPVAPMVVRPSSRRPPSRTSGRPSPSWPGPEVLAEAGNRAGRRIDCPGLSARCGASGADRSGGPHPAGP